MLKNLFGSMKIKISRILKKLSQEVFTTYNESNIRIKKTY